MNFFFFPFWRLRFPHRMKEVLPDVLSLEPSSSSELKGCQLYFIHYFFAVAALFLTNWTKFNGSIALDDSQSHRAESSVHSGMTQHLSHFHLRALIASFSK